MSDGMITMKLPRVGEFRVCAPVLQKEMTAALETARREDWIADAGPDVLGAMMERFMPYSMRIARTVQWSMTAIAESAETGRRLESDLSAMLFMFFMNELGFGLVEQRIMMELGANGGCGDGN